MYIPAHPLAHMRVSLSASARLVAGADACWWMVIHTLVDGFWLALIGTMNTSYAERPNGTKYKQRNVCGCPPF